MNVLSYILLLYEDVKVRLGYTTNKAKVEFRKFLISHIEEAAFSQ